MWALSPRVRAPLARAALGSAPARQMGLGPKPRVKKVVDIFPEDELPQQWRKLGARRVPRPAPRPHPPHTPAHTHAADYKSLEVWDTADVVRLEEQLADERGRLLQVYAKAKHEERPVIWKNAKFDVTKVDRILGWLKTIQSDQRREW